MKKYKYLLLFALSFFLFSCGDETEDKTAGFSINLGDNDTNFQLNDTIKASIGNANERIVDSIHYIFQNEKIASVNGNNPATIVLQNHKLGNHSFNAVVFSEGDKIEVGQNLKIFSNKKPVTYTYEVIEAYPHNPNAYTQGLEFHNDTLYESTGQYGRSSLRKVDYKTGEVISQLDLPDNTFAEGLTIMDNKIYQLTWQQGEGYIYDIDSFTRTGSFAYNQSEEGWGLCNNGAKLYKSDGTEKIWILDPGTLSEENYIQIATHNSIVSQMNELEWVEGMIYANTYQKDGIAIINPTSGAVVGVIDFRGLRDLLGNTANLDPANDVLNGVAYNPLTEKLYVTGKDWDTLFEVEIFEK